MNLFRFSEKYKLLLKREQKVKLSSIANFQTLDELIASIDRQRRIATFIGVQSVKARLDYRLSLGS